MSAPCACGHDEAAHADADDAPADFPAARPCFASDLAGRICACSEWRPRRPAAAWVRSINAILRRIKGERPEGPAS